MLLDFERPIHDLERRIEELKKLAQERPELQEEVHQLEEQATRIRRKIYARLTPWQVVQIARHADRPHAVDYIERIFTDFVEFHGDRRYGDDPAIITGFATLEGIRLVLIAQEKGRDTKEKLHRNFGMPHPEGYRKAIRAVQIAEKFGLPVVSLVDTPGAYPGVGAEERGQFMAIAESIRAFVSAQVPTVAVIIGEGGSGGALAIAATDRVYALQYAIYSVISPEGCAAILWRDGKRAPEAAEALKITAQDLLELGVIDGIVPEPLGGAHWAPEEAARALKETLIQALKDLLKTPLEALLEARRRRYLAFGSFSESPQET